MRFACPRRCAGLLGADPVILGVTAAPMYGERIPGELDMTKKFHLISSVT